MSTKAPSNIGVMDLDKRAVRALTRPMLVVEDDPECWDDNEVAVYHEDRRHICNPVVGFCDCSDHHYRDATCQHLHRARYALGFAEVPDWVDWSEVDAFLRERLEGEAEVER